MKNKFLSIITITTAVLFSLTACGIDEKSQSAAGSANSVISGSVNQSDLVFEPAEEPVVIESADSSEGETTKEDTITASLSENSTTAVKEMTDSAPVLTPEEYQELKVHFIDVGQGDSCFVELPNGETMLIDAGEEEYGDTVVTYVFSQGYDTIDYVVASHPHSDHIGGIDDVLSTFNIGNLYMTGFESTSQAYERMLDAAQNSGAAIHEVMAGSVILEAPELLVEIVAPKTLVDDCNNNSIVIKLTYGNTKFLFTGDAEKVEEDGIWTNIKCDVLKVGHHGANTSSSANFLKKVEPTYAVISCGMGNKYGHPTDEVLARLDERNIQVFRTDLQGTIIISSDGEEISVNKPPTVYQAPVQTTVQTTASTIAESGIQYVLNTNSKKIHLPNCSSVNDIKDKNKAYTDDYDAAIASGYVPCKRCLG